MIGGFIRRSAPLHQAFLSSPITDIHMTQCVLPVLGQVLACMELTSRTHVAFAPVGCNPDVVYKKAREQGYTGWKSWLSTYADLSSAQLQTFASLQADLDPQLLGTSQVGRYPSISRLLSREREVPGSSNLSYHFCKALDTAASSCPVTVVFSRLAQQPNVFLCRRDKHQQTLCSPGP